MPRRLLDSQQLTLDQVLQVQQAAVLLDRYDFQDAYPCVAEQGIGANCDIIKKVRDRQALACFVKKNNKMISARFQGSTTWVSRANDCNYLSAVLQSIITWWLVLH